MIDLKIKRLMASNNVSRDNLQSLSVEFAEKYKHVWFKFGTGVGKSRAAGLIADGKRTLLVCQRVLHIENWREDLDKFGMDYSKWDFTCYNSIHKYVLNEYDVVILDEADCTTDKTVESLNQIKRDKTVLLTADASIEKQMILKPLYVKEWKISLKLAQKWKLLPIAKVYCVEVVLDNKLKYLDYVKFGNTVKVTEEEYLKLIEKDIEYWKDRFKNTGNDWDKLNMLRKGLDRKKFFNECKKRVGKQIWEGNKYRSVVFTSDIAESNTYENAIHSKNSNEVNQGLVDKFNNGEINTICNVNCLTRGQNLSNIKVGIINSFSSNGIALLQQQGRIYRGEDITIFIPYVKNTKNETDLLKFINKTQLEVEWANEKI